MVLRAQGEEPGRFGALSYQRLSVEGYASRVASWIDTGATIVGGCCFTSPVHIARLRRLIEEREA